MFYGFSSLKCATSGEVDDLKKSTSHDESRQPWSKLELWSKQINCPCDVIQMSRAASFHFWRINIISNSSYFIENYFTIIIVIELSPSQTCMYVCMYMYIYIYTYKLQFKILGLVRFCQCFWKQSVHNRSKKRSIKKCLYNLFYWCII